MKTEVTLFDPAPALEKAIGELTADQAREFELAQAVLDKRVDMMRAREAARVAVAEHDAALASLLQFRAEQVAA